MTKKRTPIPQGVRFDVFRRDNFTCVYCGVQSPDATLHADHKLALANGGSDDISNLVTACQDCNFGKGTKKVRHTIKRTSTAANDGGLVGVLGHRKGQEGNINNQFEIIGMVGSEFCTIQLFSFSDGCPTNVEILKVSDLSGSEYSLYATKEQWKRAFWEEKERRGLLWRKTAEEALEMDLWMSRKRRGVDA